MDVPDDAEKVAEPGKHLFLCFKLVLQFTPTNKNNDAEATRF